RVSPLFPVSFCFVNHTPTSEIYSLSLHDALPIYISGTMWMVTLLFVYGVKSVWVPWLWPVFNQIFLMVYLSAWLRRSNVLTGAEDRKSTRLNSSHVKISYAVFCLKKKSNE